MKQKIYLNFILLLFFITSLGAIETKEVDYFQGVEGYLAIPDKESKKKYPAVLLIHEWWGLNDEIREKAKEFAEAGYVALAVDMYKGEVATKPAKARKLAGEVRQNMEEAFKNLKAGISYLKSTPEVNPDKIASVGWCFGGGWSYQIAKNNLGTKASVIYYGRFNPADDLEKMRASILGHFAEKDRGIKVDNVREFQVKLKTLSGEHEVYIYPNTGHGFSNPNNPVYDKKATQLAKKRTLDFLKKNL